MIVTLTKPLNDYGYEFEAGKTIEVSMKFYRLLVAQGYCDPHESEAPKPAPKAAPKPKATPPPTDNIEE
jgi:hypothetical protein